MAKTTVAVRMYNVGFGDAFVVTVSREQQLWRMLVDCGVHSQGRARPIAESVKAIIADLKAASADGVPRLDVIVATHHHADHISGFALEDWEEVDVDEVWVPFIEDEDDADAKRLRDAHGLATRALTAMIDQRVTALGAAPVPDALDAARAFAMNSFGNADATDRLLSRNGLGFATKPRVRYLPSLDAADNLVKTTIDGVVAHVLGPSRDPAQLKRMDPPAGTGWLRFGADVEATPGVKVPLFHHVYVARSADDLPADLTAAQADLRLDELTDDAEVLAAASILERAVNNTSVFFVLDVAGTRLLFPGDAQQGAWDHVLSDETSRALVKDVAFYKIGHHGSHNATPKGYVADVLGNGAYAMLPFGLVERWKATIPKTELLDALHAHDVHVTRADAPVEEAGHVVVHGDLWSEVTLTAG
jgi:beta-lactamase superfamily II metal-dependent hydrolase